MEVELMMDMLELLESRSSEKFSDEASTFNSADINVSSKESSNQLSNDHQLTHTNSKLKSFELFQSVSSLLSSESKKIKNILSFEMSTQSPMIKSFIFGSFSGTCSTILFQPFDLLKTRQQNPQLKSQNFLGLSWKIIQTERPTALWRGTVPSLIRSVPGIGLYFCSLNALERTFCKQENGKRIRPNALEAALFGLTARCSVGILLMPATVIKTRLESGLFDYNNVNKAFITIHRCEGIRGLYSGVAATLMRDAPFSAIYYMFYTQMRKITAVNGNNLEQNTVLNQSAVSFLCGLVAGLSASIITQPPDVIKTHMQLRPDKYPNLRLTTLAILNEHGFNGLFRGLVPRMIRRTLMSSLAWTVYESFAQQYNLK